MSKRTVELELATPGLDAQGRPARLPLAAAAPEPERLSESGASGEHMLINLGPQHPATHGVLRLVVELDGETVVRVIPHLGYLHSGFEKLGEYRHYNQIIPLTDRTDYLSPMANNVGFALAAEKLMGIEITPRCTVLRVIACEMSRIISHMVWLGTTSIDLGAFTPFLWAFQERERIYNLQEMWTGARLTTSVTRVGGLMADARHAGGEPGAGPHLLEIVDALALLERPEKRGERAEVDRRGAEPDHVGDDPAHLARHHPQHLTARRDLDAHQLLGREREADVVRHRRQIVGAVGERDDLVVVRSEER